MQPPGQSQWAEFSLSRDGSNLGCLLGGAVYWWTASGGFRLLDSGLASQGGVGMAAEGGALVAARPGATGAVPTIWYRDGSSRALAVELSDCGADHQVDGGFDLNADCTVVVGQVVGCDGERAFRWSNTSGLVELPAVPGGDSRGTAVSADGRVIVGFCESDEGGYRRPVIWRAGRKPVFFLGADHPGEALNISLNGQFVVGQAQLGGLSPQAFFWQQGTAPVSLGNLSGRATDTSLARAVADNGTVVGWSGDALWGDQEAFVWSAQGGMQSCARLLAAQGAKLPEGVLLTAALDISGDGRTVVGTCRDKDWNQGYWMARLGETVGPVSDATTRPWRPAAMDHLAPDSLDVLEADMLNPFPFGRRRY